MKPIITTEIVVAYAHCPRKAYLLLSNTLKGIFHEYVQILEKKRTTSQEQYLRKLAQNSLDVHAYELHGLESKSRFLTNAILKHAELEADCGLLTKAASHSSLGHYSYEPTIFVGTYSISKEQTLALLFAAHVLGQLQNRPPANGYIIDVTGESHKVDINGSAQTLLHVLEPLREWVADTPLKEPSVILNKHCSLCQFRNACQATAEQEDNLSLLDKATPKIMRQYEKKGIFTVKQLSYTFRPRKRKKHAKNAPPVTHSLELQALAIRKQKIYLQELPDLIRQPIELFLDIEGIPDQNAYYLIGLLVCEDGQSTYYSFWADSLADEEKIWQQFVEKINEYPNASIYHYGHYEAKVLTKLAKRYDTNCESLIERLVNVNRCIYGKLFFPVYSNSLKDIGKFIGAAWSSPDASGLQSLVWWHYWDETQDLKFHDLLVTYNQEDCQTLKLLVDELAKIKNSADVLSKVDFAFQTKQLAGETNQETRSQFSSILKSAHFEYDEKKISLSKNEEQKITRRRVPRSQKVPPKATRMIEVPQGEVCPKCGFKHLRPTKNIAKRVIIDLRLTKSGVRKLVIAYFGIRGYCPNCGKISSPPGIRKYERQQMYDHGLKAWLIYHRVGLRLPYESILESLEEQFNVQISAGRFVDFMGQFAIYYADTDAIIKCRLLDSSFIHVDETKVSINGVNWYIWVFTDGKYITFKLTETREATVVHELLTGYRGVLISDFYAGYDSVPCPQQKCWVHLIRDFNDDLQENPFDAEFEAFVLAVKNLIVPIMEAVQQHGLKKRNLNKFREQVNRFYIETITGIQYKSDLALKYQKRFIRYRDSLFTFLEQDGISWHNNAAERAIRPVAKQRAISTSFS